MVQFSRINLKFTAISLIGLTIGLSMLAAPLFLTHSLKADFMFTSLDERTASNPDISITIRTRDSNVGTLDTLIDFENFIDLQISKHNLTRFIQRTPLPLYGEVGSFSFVRNTSEGYWGTNIPQIGIYGLNESILNYCMNGSRLPSNQNETIFYDRRLFGALVALNERIDFTCHYPEGNGQYTATLTAVGIITPSTLTEGSIYKSIINDLTQDEQYCIITSMNWAFDLAHTIKKEIDAQIPPESNYEYKVFAAAHYKYTFNFSAVTRDNVLAVVDSIPRLEASLGSLDLFPEYEGFTSYARLSFLPDLKSDLWQFNNLFPSFVYTVSLVLIIVLLLVNFSLGLINVKRKKSLVMLKTRGLSNRFVFLTMFLETCVIALGSSLLALLVGMPLSLVLGSSTGLLAFNNPINPSRLIVTPEAIQLIFLGSFLLALLVHLPSLASLSRSNIGALSEPSTRKKARKISIVIGKLDVLFFSLGSVGIALISILILFLRSSPSGQVAFSFFLDEFMLLFLSSLLLFFIGFISAFNRLIPKIIHKLGTFFWKRDWRLLAHATRNLGVSPYVTNRITLLIAITLGLLVVFSILPETLHANSIDNAFYEIGSEISYSTRNTDHFNRVVTDLRNISGFSFTIIKELSLDFSIPDENNPNSYYAYSNDLMGIEEDFAQGAHWQSYYDDEPLATLVKTLFDAEVNNSVIVDSRTLVREHFAIGGSYSISTDEVQTEPYSATNTQIPVSVRAATNFWPRLIRGTKINGGYFITKTSFLDELGSLVFDPYSTYNPVLHVILGQVLPEYDTNQVLSSIQAVISNQTHSLDGLHTVYDYGVFQEDNILNMFLWFSANANLVATLAIVLSAIILFMVMKTLKQAQELALSRSLGMKLPQLYLLTFMEPLILFVVSGVPGTLVGTILVFVSILQTGMMATLPYHPQICLFPLISCYVLFFIILVIIGLVNSLMVTRTNISKMLKVE
ncbi:MAG: FtsX-like permease family protein [Promethearchaeota archaeon]